MLVYAVHSYLHGYVRGVDRQSKHVDFTGKREELALWDDWENAMAFARELSSWGYGTCHVHEFVLTYTELNGDH